VGQKVGTICVGKCMVHGYDPPEVQGFLACISSKISPYICEAVDIEHR